ncbi:biotin synthase BioB [candidate division KSB3 bacterium]|uniref:Biotin synthase n=1 Tax=candidate division KSB3 bacterium TaxID=2044937 RepID=A0A2G6E6B3_9BACT|nr:MAG: biotin synthase BioB [candidate division KSB3 bacterium]PIE30091.1 MAG: biotin synthase BioB [candidate division KSB3 bacterium]
MLDSAIQKAYNVLEHGRPVDRDLARELAELPGEDILDLLSLANKVTNRYTDRIHSCSIVNAKSGLCRENCRFCAQSTHHHANVEVYALLSPERILAEAEKTVKNGVNYFGIVTSGFGYPVLNKEFRSILDTIDLLNDKLPEMNVCLSLGILSQETVKELAERKVCHYNINLQVTPGRFADLIARTHDIQEKLKTIQMLKSSGIGVCCGGILGVGETMSDRVELAFTLQDLDVDVIPLNVLVPIPGTPLENQPPLPVADIAKTFAIFRLVNPGKIIKFAAGRETLMKDFQGLLMLSGANGFLTGGYLTTRGREVHEDKRFIDRLEAFR